MKKYLTYPRFLLLLATQLMVGLAAAQSNYFPQLAAIISTEGWPEQVRIGDVTGDGIADIVLINNGYVNAAKKNHVVVFRLGENGAYSAPVTFEYTQLVGQDRSLQLLNVDDDDALEIVAGVDQQLLVANYNEAGSFDVHTLNTFTRNDRLATIDINLDGQQDLVSVQTTGLRMAVMYLTDGHGSLNVYDSLDLSSRGDQFEVAVADMNDDGRDDLLLMHGGAAPFSQHVWVYLHDGQAGFAAPSGHAVGGPFDFVIVKQLTTADLNQDGLTDVLLSASDGMSYLLTQRAVGGLNPAVTLDYPNHLADTVAVDVDGNGQADIITVHDDSMFQPAALGTSFQVGGQLSNLDLTYLPKNMPFDPQAMTVGDINGDGCNDVVIADALQGMVVHRGVNCVNAADLQLLARPRVGKGFVVQLRHLTGSGPVSDAMVQIEVTTEAPDVIFFDQRYLPVGCVLNRPDRLSHQISCETGMLAVGDHLNWYFRFNVLDRSYEEDILITGQASADAIDPNPVNNDFHLVMEVE